MKLPARPLRLYAPMLAVLAFGMGWNVSAGAATSQLDWQSKTDDQAAAYPVPPSPYGQVGDPFVHTLRWPTKAADPQPVAQPTENTSHLVAVPAAPVKAAQMASIAAPVPLMQPQPIAVVALPPPAVAQPAPVSAPAPVKSDDHPDPGLADDPGMADDAPIIGAPQVQAVAVSAPPAAPTQPIMAAPAPTAPPASLAVAAPVAPSRPVVAAQTTPAAIAAQAAQTDKELQDGLFDGGFQVPSSSPYAARIAAARAAASQNVQAQPQTQNAPTVQAAAVPQTAKADPAPAIATPVSAPATTLASAAADHPFIPGEHYTDASQEPRFYSLHREYGYRPDPITVDENATGAILTVTPDKPASTAADDSATDDSASKSTDQKGAAPATNP